MCELFATPCWCVRCDERKDHAKLSTAYLLLTSFSRPKVQAAGRASANGGVVTKTGDSDSSNRKVD